jgi:tetratricopeptide (TPR) repeat protein
VAAGYSAAGRCSEAESLLTRSLDLDRAAGRTQSPGTQLQLGDIWMRQARYDKAVEAFRVVIAADPNSVDAWRGYLVALHNRNDDRTMLAESRRIPTAPRAELGKDPGFTTLIAGAHADAGEYDQSVALLEDARGVYQASGKVPPADFDVQLGWALLKTSRAYLVGDLVARTRQRTDLTPVQRQALDEMWLSAIMTRVDAAMQREDAASAITILSDAWREAPNDPQIPSALAAIHLKKGDRARALEVYQTWGFQGATAGDYRAAAGAALAQRDTITADRLLSEGLKQFPNDRDLLRMNGRQAVGRGDYRDAEKLLKAALAAKPEPTPAARPRAVTPPQPRSQAPERACTQDAARGTASGARWTTMPAGPRVILASMRQTPGAQVPPAQPPPAQTPPTTTPPTSAPPKADEAAPAEPSASPRAQQTEQTAEIEDDIDVVKNRNTPFASGGIAFSGRDGDPGLSRLIVRDVTPGGQATFGNAVRVGIDVHALTLTSGTPDGLSGYRFGTLPLGATFVEQQASGYTAEVQVAGTHAGASIGTPASEFLVKTWTGGLRLGAVNGPLRLIAVRERVKDSLLAYAGERDPGTGLVWGGVVSNAVSIQASRDHEGDGAYLSLGGALLRGENVANNWSAEATAGAYWSVSTGGPTSLTLGVSGTALHYDKNLSFFSLGHGGYFSPQQFLQGSFPLSWSIRHSRLFWEMQASPGFQYFTTDAAPFYPLGNGPAVPFGPVTYDDTHNRGATYNVNARLEYRLTAHLHFSAFGGANNTRDFNARTIGVALRLLANRLPGTTNLRVRAVPDWRGNQPLGN